MLVPSRISEPKDPPQWHLTSPWYLILFPDLPLQSSASIRPALSDRFVLRKSPAPFVASLLVLCYLTGFLWQPNGHYYWHRTLPFSPAHVQHLHSSAPVSEVRVLLQDVYSPNWNPEAFAHSHPYVGPAPAPYLPAVFFS